MGLTTEANTREPSWIRLGHPSYVWRAGQQRRLDLVRKYVPLEGRRIVDVGCGIGTYVRRFRDFSDDVHGVDIDAERVRQASESLPNISVAPAEQLPFETRSVDVVLLHEVIEHVDDDRQAILEASRVLRPGGHLVIYAPNRLYPFETHGVYWRGRFVFGNIPLVNYLPDRWRRRLAPHVRVYSARGLRSIVSSAPLDVIVHTCVYPGFDNVVTRLRFLGRVLRSACYLAERTPLRAFGLSHFVVCVKRQEA